MFESGAPFRHPDIPLDSLPLADDPLSIKFEFEPFL